LLTNRLSLAESGRGFEWVGVVRARNVAGKCIEA
jgi:hypothetical protein